MAFRIISSLLFCLLLIGCIFSTSQAQEVETDQQGFARISLRNNSWKFRRFTIITYRPGERENSTFSFRLVPGTSRNFWLPVGTRVYNASQRQVATVMSGQPLSGKPMLTVAASDDGRIFPLVH